MKRYKKLIILGAVLVAAVIAVIVVSKIKVHQENINSTVEVLVDIDPENVTELSWTYDDSKLAFYKDESAEEETWHYQEDENFPVSNTQIANLLSNFKEFEIEFTIDDVDDYAQYGLEKPMCTVTITSGDTTYELKFGNYSKMDEKRYVSIGDGKVYLASIDPTDDFNIELADMIQNDQVPSFEQINTIDFKGISNYEVYSDTTGTLSVCADDIYFTDANGAVKPLDTELVDSYISKINKVDMSEYATYNATEEEIATYGLDDPEITVNIAYSYTDEDAEASEENEEAAMLDDTFAISISRSAADKAEIEEAKAAGEEVSEDSYSAYVRIGESQIIYVISASDYAAFAKNSYDDLRHAQLFTADFEQVSSIDIVISGENYSFVKQEVKAEDSDETTTAFFLGDAEIGITDFQTALETLEVSGFTSTEPEGQEEISLTFNLVNANFSQVKIILYRYDGTYCKAVVDGETIGLISRSYVVDLMETVNAIVLD